MSFLHSKMTLSIIAAIVLTSLILSIAGLSATTGSSAIVRDSTTSGGNLYGQSYSGGLIGGYLYENNSFPFATYASTSRILALPAISSWLSENNYAVNDLRPYVTLYPLGGNPYDFSQGTITENGTTYLIYEYLVVNSSVGLVMGTWINSANSTDVAKIFTYDTCGPNIVSFAIGGDETAFSTTTTTASQTTCPTDVP